MRLCLMLLGALLWLCSGCEAARIMGPSSSAMRQALWWRRPGLLERRESRGGPSSSPALAKSSSSPHRLVKGRKPRSTGRGGAHKRHGIVQGATVGQVPARSQAVRRSADRDEPEEFPRAEVGGDFSDDDKVNEMTKMVLFNEDNFL
ncbi:hypothetical protein MRX96_018233 [Rhipicephalus microplus]